MTIALSDSARILLSNASQHDEGLANPACLKIPAAARASVIKGLLKRDLLENVRAGREHAGLVWVTDGNGAFAARITDEGLRAIGVDPDEGQPESDASGIEGGVPDGPHEDGIAGEATTGDAPEAIEAEAAAPEIFGEAATPARAATTTGLRGAAAAFLAAWEAGDRDPILAGVEALRAALAGKPAKAPRDAGAPRKPREGTKQEQVLAMLRAEGGTTIHAIAEAMEWQQHTVRGFFAGLKKKGHDVVATKVKGADTLYSL